MSQEPIRIFCGADRSQKLPFDVLADSIRRHASRAVEVRAIDNGDAPPVADPRCMPYTEFSFARFAIPALCGHQGRAIYLDSDMLVFADIAELWDTPMDGASVAIEQGSRSNPEQMAHARNRHGAVLLLDCARLDWNVASIVAGLGHAYNYNELMSLDPLLAPGDMRELIPVGWNDLDRFVPQRTRNLHFTEIRTQPWVSVEHPHGGLWVDALRDMLANGRMDAAAVHEEVQRGHVRPSLLIELGLTETDYGQVDAALLAAHDRAQGYVAHRRLLERFAQRKQAIAKYRATHGPWPRRWLDALRYRLRY